jgi:hypothetical protein
MGTGCVVAFFVLGMWWAFRHQFFNFPKEKLEGLEWGCAGGGGEGVRQQVTLGSPVNLTLSALGKGTQKKFCTRIY